MRPRAEAVRRSHFSDQWAEIFVGEAFGLEPKQRQRGEQGMGGRSRSRKSLVSVMVVSVRGGLPLLLDRGGLSSTCRLGVTPAVITLVWNRPGVARGPRRIGRGGRRRD